VAKSIGPAIRQLSLRRFPQLSVQKVTRRRLHTPDAAGLKNPNRKTACFLRFDPPNFQKTAQFT
jgi:hypothetical protein